MNETFLDDEVKQKQSMIPATFECKACGLKIAGYSKLAACGLGDAFTATTTCSTAEYFGLYAEEELDEARGEVPEDEDGFNE